MHFLFRHRAVRRLFLTAFAGAFLLGFRAMPAWAEIRDLPTITILAPQSTEAALSTLARLYSREASITVTTSFDAPRTLADSIVEGQPADVFISDDVALIRNLKRQGVIDVYSQTELMYNQLVVAASPQQLPGLEPYTTPPGAKDYRLPRKIRRMLKDHTLLIPDVANSTAGIYANASIRHMHFTTPPVVMPDSVALAQRLESEQSVGILYASDLSLQPRLHALYTIPETLHAPIVYRAVVVAGKNMTAARGFLDFLKSDTAKAVFTRYGFEVEK